MAVATDGASNDVLGGGGASDPTQASEQPQGVEAPADGASTEKPDEEKEEVLVKRWWKEYEDARKFDENFRKQVAVDRRYAAGTQDLTWAVTTNLIGAFIDILTAILYARDPDVSVTKSPQVDNGGTVQMQTFARTLQIVISQLWARGKLKKAAKKSVRSILSTAEGWLKCNLVSEKTPQPEVERALNDARETVAYLQAQQKMLEDPDENDPETREALLAEKQELIESLQDKLELAVQHMFVVDFVPTENMQVSTDVAQVEDHLDADWNANEIYITPQEALKRFARLTAEDLKEAKNYYKREPRERSTRENTGALPQGMITAESAQAYTTSSSSAEQKPFIRVIELWDRCDKMIRTFIEGVDKWAKEPYPPPYPTSRFYPYFYTAFYEVDGERHAQSLAWRLYKLQDEYSQSRSAFRLTRQRSVPGILFNATMLDETEARKLEQSKEQEYTGLRPSDSQTPLGNCFAAKPLASIDMRLYDPTLVLNDMERVSGVQEALSSAINAPGNPKTATEANIEQQGTAARTGSDRDALEDMLSDLAQYTAEQALQCLTIRDAMRFAGTAAFWPEGMAIEDLFTLVEVTIEAGTTGKPRTQHDQQAWATILPLIKETLGQIEQALASGNQPLANSLIELVKETMLRMGDESDPDRFIPKTPPPGSPGAGAPPPPVQPNVNVSIKGVIDPATAAALVQPVVARDAQSMPPPSPGPGAPPGPLAPPAAAGAPGAGPAPAPTPPVGP